MSKSGTTHGTVARGSAAVVVIALIAGCLGFIQSQQQVAFAASVGTYNRFGWNDTPRGGNYWREAPVVDTDSLYVGSDNGSGNSTYGDNGWFGVVAKNGVLPTSRTPLDVYRGASLNDNQRVTNGGMWLSTIAVDGGGPGATRTPYVYAWTYNSTNNVSGAPNNSIALTRTVSGQRTAQYTFVPTPNFFESGPANSWNGGEVNQITGEVAFSTPGNGSCINGNFRIMLFDPNTGAYNYSGRILPETSLDNIFGANDLNGDNQNGTVASDMAFDAKGRAYVLVQNTSAIRHLGLSADPEGRAVLVRINPGQSGAAWTYTVVTVVKPAPGQPQRGQGGYSTGLEGVVEGFGIWGSAFYEGYLYAWSDWYAVFVRIDPVTGYAYRVPENSTSQTTPRYWTDLASAQTAFIIDGTVYADTNGDAKIGTGEVGIDSQTVALYRKNGAGNYVLLTTTQTTGSGNYTFMLNGEGDYAVRLVQPRINYGAQWANAVQTYASAGGTLNPVTPKCGSTYQGVSGACGGNLAVPYIDPNVAPESQWGTATMALGDMPIYTAVTMNSDTEVATADFGVTAAGSWGDAQTNYVSTGAAQGPRFVQGTDPVLWLGGQPGEYSNGVNDVNSAAHSTDDGMFVVNADGSTTALQDAVLVGGKDYTLRGVTNGSGAGASTVYGWVSNLTALGEATVTPGGSPVFQAASDGVYAESLFQPVADTGFKKAVARFIVAPVGKGVPAATNSANWYGPASGNAAANTQLWTVPGEVEDYRFYVANALVRLAASANGKVPSDAFTYTLSNTSTTAPSTATDSILLATPGVSVSSSAVHAVTTPGSAVSITSSDKAGWTVSLASSCSDSQTGMTVASTVDTAARTITYTPTISSDVTCKFVYDTFASPTESTLAIATTTPSASQVVSNNTDSYTVTATVKAASGLPMAGEVVTFGLYDQADTSEITDTNVARLSAATCTTVADGTCSITVYARVVGTYKIRGSINQAGSTLAQVSQSPVTATFTYPDAHPDSSVFVLGSSSVIEVPAGQPVDVTAATPAQAAAQTASVDKPAGYTFHINVAVWDDGQVNLIPGATVKAVLSGANCDATFDSGGKSTQANSGAAGTGGVGTAVFTVTSPIATSCTVTVSVVSAGVDVPVAGSVKTLNWVDSAVATATYTVTPATAGAAIVADDTETGTITVTLRDASALAVTNQAANLSGAPEVDSRITVGAFTHTTNGVYTATWTGKKAGTFDLGVSLAGGPAVTVESGGNGKAFLKPGAPTVGPFDCLPTEQGTNLSTSSALLTVGGSAPVVVLVTDAYCNPVTTPVDVTFATTDGSLSTLTQPTDTAGKATVTLTDSTARTDYVSATVGGNAVSTLGGGTNVAITFTAGSADPASSTLEAVTTGPKTVATETHTARVTVRDGSASHNPLAGQSVTFSASWTKADGTSGTATFTDSTDAAGEVEWTFTQVDATVRTVTASISAGQVPPVPGVQFEFVAGPPDVTRTLASFTVGSVTVKADGVATVPAQMIVQDQYGNPIAGQSCSFDATYAGTNGAVFPGSVKSIGSGPTLADGVCATTLTSYYPGAFPVTGTFAGSTAPSQDAKFNNQAIDPANSFWSVAPTAGNSKDPAVADNSDSYTVTINLRDAGNAVINAESVTIGYTLTPSGTEQTLEVTSVAPSGIATGVIRTTVAGVYNVRVFKGSDTISTTPSGSVMSQSVTFQAGDPDPIRTASTWVASTGKVLNDNSSTHYASLTVLDQFDNPVKDTPVEFTLDSSKAAHFTGGSTGQSQTPLSGTDGKITVYVASGSAEITQITATLSGSGVGSAPFEFGPGAADASKSTFAVTPASVSRTADGVESFEGTVTVNDGSGIPVGSYSVAFDVPASVHIVEAGPYVTDPSGQVTVHFTSTVAGEYTVNALIGSEKVPTVDQKIKFVAGPASLTVSTFDVSTGKVYADGVASHSATAVVRDAHGNPVSGVTVTFNIEQGSLTIAGPVLDSGSGVPGATATDVSDENGVATVSVTSDEPGTFAATATIGVDAIAGYADSVQRNRSAQFTSGDPDPASSSRAVIPDTDLSATASVAANGSDSFAITVTIKSNKGIKVENATVRLAGLDPAVTVVEGLGTAGGLLTGLPTSGNYGTFTWHASSTTAGSFTAQVQVRVGADWFDVGSLVKLNFSANAPDAASSWLVEPLSSVSVVADNVATLPVSAYVFDVYGNAVPSGSVTFTIPAGTSSGAVTGPNTVVASVSGGVATIDVRGTVAAVHEVTASVGGSQIDSVKQAPGRLDPVVASDGIAHVRFVAGVADLSSSLLTVPTASGGATKLADGVDAHTAQVVVRDVFANLVTSGSVTFQYSYTDFAGVAHSGVSASQPIDPVTGIAVWDFSSTVAKVWTITASVDGVSGFVTPATGVAAGFHAGVVDPARTVASLQVGGSAKPDGVASVAAWMTVQDAFGNPVAGQVCGFALTDVRDPGAAKFDNADTGSFSKSGVGPTLDDGKCTVEIRSIYTGSFPVKGIFATVETPGPLPEAVFTTVVADATKSFWSVVPKTGNSTNPATANGTDAYIVTVNLRDAANAIANNLDADVYYKLTPTGTEQLLTVKTGASGNPAGTATASIQTTAAGVYDVYVKVGGDPVAMTAGGTVFTAQVEFVPDVPDGVESSLTSAAGSVKANGVAELSVSATVKDVHGNLINNRPVVFSLPVDVKSGLVSGPGTVTVDTNTAGVAVLPLTSVKPGTYSITASVDGVAIVTGSPATATFVNDDLDLTGSVLELVTSGLKTVGVESHTVRATLLDAQGNVFTPARTVSFFVKAPGAGTWTPLGAGSTVAGVAEYTFTQTVSGTWQVRAEVTSGSPTGKVGAGADGTIVDAQFRPGVADASVTASSWSGSTGKVLNDDTATHYVSLIVQDQYGNPVQSASVDFTLDASKAAHFTSSAGVGDLGKTRPETSDVNGEIRMYLASSAAETTTITATLGGVSVVKSAGPSKFEFGPGAADAANSVFTITPAYPVTRTADGNASFEATVTVRDGANIPVGSYAVNFSVPAGVHIVESAPYVTNGSGQVTVHFTSTVADEYTVNALIGTAKIPVEDQLIKFVAGPIDWTKASLAVSANGAIANGTATNKVVATLVDAYSNPIIDGFVNFQLPAGVAAVGSATGLTTDSNGQVEVSLTSETAASYAITATASKATPAGPSAILVGSPASVTFIPGPVVAGQSVLSVVETGPKTADGAAFYTVNIELRDAKGNTVTTAGTGVHYTFNLAGYPSVDVDTTTAASGVASTQFKTTHAGVWSVTGTYGGTEVSGSPKPLTFVAGVLDPAVSTFDVTGGPVQADGSASHRAWTVITDKDGNPISGVNVTFTITTGAATVPGPVLGTTLGTPGAVTDVTVTVPTGSDGVAEVFITSNEPGTFPVTAKVSGTPITGSAVAPLNRDAQFSSGDPDPSLSSRTVTPDTDATPLLQVAADGTASYAITTTIVSAFGTRVENATVRLAGLDPAVTLAEGTGVSGGLLTGLPTSGNYGTFTWHASSTMAGSFTAQVQVRVGADWFDVGAPVTLNFKADTPALECELGVTACTSYTVTPVTQEVGKPVNVSVLVTDKYGNPVLGTRVTLESAPGGVFAITSPVDADGNPITDGTGHVTATLTDRVAQIDNVRAKIGGAGSSQYISTEATALLPAADRVTSVAVTFTPGVPTVGPFDCLPGKSGTSFNFDPLLGVPLTTSSVGTVKVTDAFCNPIQGANVMFTSTGGTFTPASGSVFTTAAGTVTIDLTDSVERVDTVTATVGGLHIAVTGTEVVGVTPVTSQNVEFIDPFFDGTAPTAPLVDPTNGTEITGSAEPGSTVKVVDATGKPVPGCDAVTVGADGRFACNPNPTLTDGAEVSVTATDPAGNESAPTFITVGAIGFTMSPAKAYRGDNIILRGFNFIAGEKVTVVCNSVTVTLGTFTAGRNGQVIVPNWVVPADFDFGQHVCTFTGDKSGPVSAPLQILEPVVVTTGGSTSTPASTVVVAASGLPVAVLPKRKLV